MSTAAAACAHQDPAAFGRTSDGVSESRSSRNPPPEEVECLLRILDVLRERTGHDFSRYRLPTVLRRVRNRMIAANVRTLEEYLERLLVLQGEEHDLLERLTIKVSCFFRDAAVYDALRRALEQRLLERGRSLRAWSAGCGAGEEAYSLAILLSEIGQVPCGPDVVGTDIDPRALDRARAGEYAATAVEDLPQALREVYFGERRNARGPVFAVQPGLRERVSFRLHDVTTEPGPADGGRFDLICCRNVLIYLRPSLQERVQRLLARALLPGGLLCLGAAEWLLPAVSGSFEVVDRKARLYRLADASWPGAWS